MASRTENKSRDWLYFENIQPVAVYHQDPIKLEIDPSLKLPQIKNINQTGQVADITLTIPEIQNSCNLYLYAQGKKIDLYYNVLPGDYTFRRVKFHNRKEMIVFYVVGLRRSGSVKVEVSQVNR